MARTITNAEYQLNEIMPTAKEEGCTCEFTEADFQDFINYKWWHKPNCPAPHYECLPNAIGLLEALRAGRGAN